LGTLPLTSAATNRDDRIAFNQRQISSTHYHGLTPSSFRARTDAHQALDGGTPFFGPLTVRVEWS
jgi:hypothetical protein